MNMAIKEDVEDGTQRGIREPLVEATKGHPWMVYFSTFVAVWGSYEFGTCVGVWFIVELSVAQITFLITSNEDVVKLKYREEALKV